MLTHTEMFWKLWRKTLERQTEPTLMEMFTFAIEVPKKPTALRRAQLQASS